VKSRWMVSAGVVDSGLASLATFLVGIAAVRYLDPVSLGGYALTFSAFSLAAVVPAQMLFLPAQVATVALPKDQRLPVLKESLVLGLVPALVPALAVYLCVLAMPADVSAEVRDALLWTAAVCSFLSPIQDHLRRMLHIGGRSWMAALLSLVQLAVSGIAIASMLYAEVPGWWIPFGALSIANLASLAVGLVLLRHELGRGMLGRHLALPELLRSGRWLLLKGLAGPAAGFAAAVIVSHVAGAVALGYAEGARIVGRPVLVFTTGFAAVLGPQSVEAGQKRDRLMGHQVSRTYHGLIGVGALFYFSIAGFDVPWNPLAYLIPNAYEITGLAALTLIATTLSCTLFPQRSELLGGRRAAALARIEVLSSLPKLLIAASASVTLAFAIPLGLLAQALFRWDGYRRELRKMYAEPEPVKAAPEKAPPIAVSSR
jgi:O-antigen/teichoic acid export membrane protein